jgi:hypothetical protein
MLTNATKKGGHDAHNRRNQIRRSEAKAEAGTNTGAESVTAPGL